MSLNDKLKDDDLKSMQLTDDDLELVAGGGGVRMPCPSCKMQGKISGGNGREVTCPICKGKGTIYR